MTRERRRLMRTGDPWSYDLQEYLGKTVGIVIKVSGGGPKHAWKNEEAFFDEISSVSE